jgi:hypothetical protein
MDIEQVEIEVNLLGKILWQSHPFSNFRYIKRFHRVTLVVRLHVDGEHLTCFDCEKVIPSGCTIEVCFFSLAGFAGRQKLENCDDWELEEFYCKMCKPTQYLCRKNSPCQASHITEEFSDTSRDK